MNKFLITVLFWFFGFTGFVEAKSISSIGTFEIKDLIMFSMQESIYPNFSGLTRVIVKTDIQWNTSTACSVSSVLIRFEDQHMISMILAAKATSSSIKLYADDTVSINNECFLRAVQN